MAHTSFNHEISKGELSAAAETLLEERPRLAVLAAIDNATPEQIEAAAALAHPLTDDPATSLALDFGPPGNDARHYQLQEIAHAVRHLQLLHDKCGIDTELAHHMYEHNRQAYYRLTSMLAEASHFPNLASLGGDPHVLASATPEQLENLYTAQSFLADGQMGGITSISDILHMDPPRASAIFESGEIGQPGLATQLAELAPLPLSLFAKTSPGAIRDISNEIAACAEPPGGVVPPFDPAAPPETENERKEIVAAILASHGINVPGITIPDATQTRVTDFRRQFSLQKT